MANQPLLLIFIRLDKTLKRDGRMDRQICNGYYSGLHSPNSPKPSMKQHWWH